MSDSTGRRDYRAERQAQAVEVQAHLLALVLRIQAVLKDALNLRPVDVRSINTAPIMVQGSIVQEGILLYSRNKDRRVAFEVLVRKKYFDYLPTARRAQVAFF